MLAAKNAYFCHSSISHKANLMVIKCFLLGGYHNGSFFPLLAEV
jgi:hypothetical protein